MKKIILIIMLVFANLTLFGQDGTLDTTFAEGGLLTTSFREGDDICRSVAIQTDGKIVAAGYYNNGSEYCANDIALVRYNGDGLIDTTFGDSGKVTTAIGNRNDNGQCIAIQADGKIVVAGFSDMSDDSYLQDDFAIVRYNSNGSLDTTFGGSGKITTPIGESEDNGQCIAIQTDEKIIVAGYSYIINHKNDFSAIRYNTDGSLDTTFGDSGKVTTDIKNNNDECYSVAIQADGKIVLAGSAKTGSEYDDIDFAVVRYNTDGSLDTTFGDNGKVTTPIGTSTDRGYSVTIQQDGKIVVTGYSSNNSNNGEDNIVLVRYNTDGSLDESFDDDGKIVTDVQTQNDCGRDVIIQTDGKIIVAGYSQIDRKKGFALLRYNTDGSLDENFDNDGIVRSDLGISNDMGYSMAIQTDGKIVVAGVSSVPNDIHSDTDFAIARYLNTHATSTKTIPNLKKDFKLLQNYPNPFNPSTIIKYEIGKVGFVTLKVYNLLGEEVTTLINKTQRAGNYEVEFNASVNSATHSSLSSGMYFYKIQSGNFSESRKMLLIK